MFSESGRHKLCEVWIGCLLAVCSTLGVGQSLTQEGCKLQTPAPLPKTCEVSNPNGGVVQMQCDQVPTPTPTVTPKPTRTPVPKPTPTTEPACKTQNQSCNGTKLCCSDSNLSCVSGKCQAPPTCQASGKTCSSSKPCCSGSNLSCLSGTCQVPPTCQTSGNTCSASSPCCTGSNLSCVSGKCQTPPVCKGFGDSCKGNGECCGNSCRLGVCSTGKCGDKQTNFGENCQTCPGDIVCPLKNQQCYSSRPECQATKCSPAGSNGSDPCCVGTVRCSADNTCKTSCVIPCVGNGSSAAGKCCAGTTRCAADSTCRTSCAVNTCKASFLSFLNKVCTYQCANGIQRIATQPFNSAAQCPTCPAGCP